LQPPVPSLAAHEVSLSSAHNHSTSVLLPPPLTPPPHEVTPVIATASLNPLSEATLATKANTDSNRAQEQPDISSMMGDISSMMGNSDAYPITKLQSQVPQSSCDDSDNDISA